MALLLCRLVFKMHWSHNSTRNNWYSQEKCMEFYKKKNTKMGICLQSLQAEGGGSWWVQGQFGLHRIPGHRLHSETISKNKQVNGCIDVYCLFCSKHFQNCKKGLLLILSTILGAQKTFIIKVYKVNTFNEVYTTN